MRRWAPILAILVAAAVVRYWAIDFCVPTTRCRPDEEAVANIVWHLFERDFNPRFFDWPSLFFYEVTVGLVPFFKLGVYLDWFRGERHFAALIGNDPTIIVLTARMLSAAAGVLSVWVLFRVARRLFDQTSALVAALFLALAFLHVRDSHFGVTDVTATCLVLVSFLFIVRFVESRARRDMLVAAVTAGLAASTKYNAAMIALPIVWTVLVPTGAPAKPLSLSARLGHCALVVTAMILAFLVTTPYAVLDYPNFLASLQGISTHLATGHGVELGRGWVFHLTSSLRYGLGWPLLAAGIAGLVLLIAKRPRTGIVIAIFPVAYYLLIGSGYTVFARYILPVVPFLCLTAAFAVSEAAQWMANRSRRPLWATGMAWALAALVIAPSAWSVVEFDRLLARTDSRLLAIDWIKGQFPDGATIGGVGRMSTRLHFLWEAPGIPSRYTSVEAEEVAADPDVLIVPTSLFAPGAELGPRAAALAARYKPLFVVEAHDPAAVGNVYDWQDEFYLPLAGFNGIRRPGPSLTIYVRPDLAAGRSPR